MFASVPLGARVWWFDKAAPIGHEMFVYSGRTHVLLSLPPCFFYFGECSLFEQVFGARLRPFGYDGLLVLSWTIPLAVSLPWDNVKDMLCDLHFDDWAVVFFVCKCPWLCTSASVLTLYTFSEMTLCFATA